MSKHNVVIVDDHQLFAGSLAGLVNSYPNYEVAYHTLNGKELIDKLQASPRIPDLVLLDINMPIMNGIETMVWLKENRPEIKVLALSMEDDEDTIIKMLRHGAKGYLLKDIEPRVFNQALDDVMEKGFYYSDRVSNTLLGSLGGDGDGKIKLKEREVEFLKLACTEKTYKEIAGEMFLSPKTIDGYREALFEKLEVRSRIGMVLYCIKHKIYRI